MLRQNHMPVSSYEYPDMIVDLDDVIFDTCAILHEVLTIETGQYVPLFKWTQYELTDIYNGLTPELLDDYVIKHDVFSRVKPIRYANRALHMFKQRGYNIHLCTARANIPNHKQITELSLKRHDIVYDTITYVNFGESKSEAYKHLANTFSYMFDDATNNIEDAVQSDLIIKPILITRPWNNQETAYIRSNSLMEFCMTLGWE